MLKYKKLRAIYRNLQNGTGIHVACKAADIEPSTLWRWRKSKPSIDKHITGIIESRIQIVEDALFKTALEGNTTAQIFFLTNRASDRWQDRRALVNNHVINNINNNPYKNLTEDELKCIAGEARISAMGSQS